MADPLSVTAGIVGFVSLGIQVTESLVRFYTAYKDQDADMARMTTKSESLLDTFRHLDAALRRRTFRPEEQDLIKVIKSSAHNCDELVQELNQKIEKFDRTSTIGIKGTIRAAGRRAAYPFRQSTLQKLDEIIGEIRLELMVTLDILQLRDHENTQNDIIELKLLLEAVRASQISSAVRDWLRAPDATINHNAACTKRHPGTGIWLVKSSVFITWLDQNNSFLWLSGFAGCGKSILCSTAIQYSFRRKRADPRIGIAFFYFTFNDDFKRDESAMLRTLLLQLSGQLSDTQTGLVGLYNSNPTAVPAPAVLIAHLKHLIQKFDQVYILVDALDESPRYDSRDQVLNAIELMRKWRFPGLHLLVTSRDEPDIRESLNPAEDDEVVMKNAEINRDIENFISEQLNMDRKLRKWHVHHDRIQRVLTERAQGVFRWVECQFESLKRCPRSESHLDHCLRSLPRGLDETYERILCSINEDSIEEARRILTLLCFSPRPLTVPELIEGIAVDLNEPAHLDLRRRLQDADDFREICPGLIDVNAEVDDQTTEITRNALIVRIAHFSVQEYLESDRISQQKAAAFRLKNASAHAEIAQICLVYLQEPSLSHENLDQTRLKEFPLAGFAAEFWHHHYDKSDNIDSLLDRLVLRKFRDRSSFFFTWVKIDNVDNSWRRKGVLEPNLNEIASPVYYASILGFDRIVHELLNICHGDTVERQNLVNARGGKHDSALQAASTKGHDKVVQILVNTGANVNAQGGQYGNALQAASSRGHDKVVQILMNTGANVNAQGGFYGNALQAASSRGHDKVVQILMNAGADVNVQGGDYGNSLQAASWGGHEKVMQILINAGANVNAQGGQYGNALQAASCGGHEKVVQMLMNAGANVNAQGGFFGNALQAASSEGHDKVMQILMDAEANVNAQGGYYGNALQAASSEGHDKVMQILMNAGANVNVQGGYYGTALQAAAASKRGHYKVVQMLMNAGANVNAQGGYYGNALQAASWRGHDKVVQMLMNAEANVNVQGGYFGNALQAASMRGHKKVVQILINAGANVNAQDEDNGNALQAASEEGYDKVVQMLLNAGADVNAQGGEYGNALQAASDEGHDKVVQMLLNAGADVNVQGGRYGNALQAASWGGHEKVVQILMNAGANVNVQGGEYGNALQAASDEGHDKVVQMLLNAGADVNVQGGRYGNALQAASRGGHDKVAQILRDAGAE